MEKQLDLLSARLNEIQTKSAYDEYGANIRAGVRALWNADFGYLQFVDHMLIALDRGYMRAWLEGAAQFGVTQDELTDEEIRARLMQLSNDIAYVYNFADAIIRGSKANGGKLSPLLQRAAMWQSRYTAVRELAKTYAGKDRKLVWILGNTKEHCSDCSKYHGKVYRASIWRRYNIYPRMWELECRGVHCQCTLNETNELATPGHPALPKG